MTALAVPICALLCAVASCSDESPAEDTKTPDAGALCPHERTMDSGDCCPVGRFYDFDSDACLAVGPPECATQLFDSPGACVPRWCWDWRDDKGACKPGAATCQAVGKRCEKKATSSWTTTGCAAGSWPFAKQKGAEDDPVCVAAGDDATRGLSADELSVVGPLAPLEKTRFCAHKSTSVDLCAEDRWPAVTYALECPAGQMPREDGGGCEPVATGWTCPPGFVDRGDQHPGDDPMWTGCRPDPSACKPGVFPDVGGATDVVYVFEGAGASGDGSKSKPLRTINAALAVAKNGATIAIGAGVYKERVAITQPVRLLGACVASTAIEAPAWLPGMVTASAVDVVGNFSGVVELDNLILRGDAIGLRVEGNVTVKARRIFVDRAMAIGVWARTSSTLTLQDAVVQGSRVGKARVDGKALDAGGLGIGITTDATGILTDVRASDNGAIGVYARNHGTIDARRLFVDATRPNPQGGNGYGVQVLKAGQAKIRGLRSAHNRDAGIDVRDVGSSLQLTGGLVHGTRTEPATGATGSGLRVTNRGFAAVEATRISDNQYAGLQVLGPGSILNARAVVVDSTVPAKINSAFAFGLSVLAAPPAAPGQPKTPATAALLNQVRITRNGRIGATVQGDTAQLLAIDSLVDSNGDWGVQIIDGGTAELHRMRISDNVGAGIRCVYEGSLVRADQLLIDHTRSRPEKWGTGQGLDIRAGARGFLRATRLSHNRLYGLVLALAKTRVDATGLLIDATQSVLDNETDPAKPVERLGTGVQLSDAADLRCFGCRFTKNHAAGITATGNTEKDVHATRALLVGGVIDRTRKSGVDEWGGIGVVANGARLEVISSRLVDNHSAAAVAWGAPLMIRHSVLAGTAAGNTGCTGADEGKDKFNCAKDPLKAMADGVSGVGKQPLVVNDSIVANNVRAGVFLQAMTNARIVRSVISGSHFGLARRDGKAPVDTANLVFGNTQNRGGGSQLSLPKAPGVIVAEP